MMESKRERLFDAWDDDPGRGVTSRDAVPGKSTLTEGLFLLRMARIGAAMAADAKRLVSEASRSGGEPLPAALRSRFESSLGTDLGAVRLHRGPDSAAAAQSVGARAYAVGSDIHFGAGEYDPDSRAGQHLLAHEVAHTVQQTGIARRAQYKLEVSHAGDSHEREADVAADAMVRGAPVSLSAATGMARSVIQRQEQGSPDADDPKYAEKAETLRLQKTLNEAATVIEVATRDLAKLLVDQKKDRKKPNPSKPVEAIKKKVDTTIKRAKPSHEKLKGMAEQDGRADAAVQRFEQVLKAWQAVAKARVPAVKSADSSSNAESSTDHAGGEASGGPDVPGIVSNGSIPTWS